VTVIDKQNQHILPDIFTAEEHHHTLSSTKLYCLVTKAHVCERFAHRQVEVSCSGSALVFLLINKVNLRRVWFVLGRVTVSGFNCQCGTFSSVCNQPPRTTQPGHPFVGKHNEYQPECGDALRLGVKADMVRVCGWQVKLSDLSVTHGPYLSTLELYHDKVPYKVTLFYLLYITRK